MHTILGVETSVTAFIGAALRGPSYRAVAIRSVAEFEAKFGGRDPRLELGYAISQFFLNGGTTSWVVRVARKLTAAKLAKALAALDRISIVNLLAMPGVTERALIDVAVADCVRRRAFLIADAPGSAATAAALLEQVDQGVWPASPDAALYFPWVYLPASSAGGEPRACAPSGSVAGLFARRDREVGVWKSPGGIDAPLRGVEKLSVELTDPARADLNARGVNCLRAAPSQGIVVWGVRTLAGRDGAPPEERYIAVRRLLLFIEESISRGTAWMHAAENGEPLWAELRSDIGAFLDGLFRAGAFAGRTPSEAYFVKCDGESTSAEDIASGIVNIIVGVAPLKPAEFAIVRIRQSAAR